MFDILAGLGAGALGGGFLGGEKIKLKTFAGLFGAGAGVGSGLFSRQSALLSYQQILNEAKDVANQPITITPSVDNFEVINYLNLYSEQIVFSSVFGSVKNAIVYHFHQYGYQ